MLSEISQTWKDKKTAWSHLPVESKVWVLEAETRIVVIRSWGVGEMMQDE